MNNGLQEESWAAVEAEAEMNYDSRPSLLPDLKKLKAAGESAKEEQFSELDSKAKNDPRSRQLWQRLPDVGPWRIMLTNLPKGIGQENLESELSQHKITANIEKKVDNRYCYLVFKDKKHCLECVNLYGKQIQGCMVQLKITKTEQQAEIRKSNTSRNSSRNSSVGTTSARFKNLSSRTGRGGEATKHRHPVGGSIRKKRSNRSNQSSSQSKPQVNPWTNDSSNQRQPPKLLSRSNRQSQNRFAPSGPRVNNTSVSRRNDDGGLGRSPYRREDNNNRRDFNRRDESFNSRRNDERDSFSRRDNSDRANFRDRGDRGDRGNRTFGGDRSDDDRGNFRNMNKGRKLREEDGRADADMSWRRGGAKPVTRKSPRDIIPATKSDKKPTDTRTRVSRGDPTRLDTDYSRTQNSTQQRRTNQMKKEQEEKLAAKKKSKNKFAALLDDEED